jgi:CheY-like chemotaxis protein
VRDYVLAWAADLMAAARIRGAAQAGGTELRLVRGADELLATAAADPPRLVVVDLEARGDPAGAIARLKADAATAALPVVAYAPHVREDAIRAARAAGAERVLARGAFVRDLSAILKSEADTA